MGRLIDMTGQRFGRLKVLELVDMAAIVGEEKRALWLCECECGNQTVVIGANLRSGATRSCGCLRRETASRKSGKGVSSE